MSLSTLTELRRSRLRPAGVKVVLGTTHAWVKDWADYVVIGPGDVPEMLDLRPLVGLPVTLVEIERNDGMFDRATKAIQAAGGYIEAIVSSAGPTGRDEEHEAILRRLRERLCN